MPGSVNGWSALLPGRTLWPGEALVSHSGVYKLRLGGDGNLVAVDGNEAPYWTSNTQGHPDLRLYMQDDGNLLLLDSHGITWWSTYTDRGGYPLPSPGAFFVLNDDGNMVLTALDGAPLWSVWQNTYDRGSGLGQWIGRAESSLGGIVEVLHDVAKVLRVALPAISAILAATGVGLPFAAALAAAGAEIAAVDAATSEIQDLVQEGEDGYHAAVAVLNDAVSPQQIAQARASLATDADRAGFDVGLEHASAIAGNAVAVQSAGVALKTINPARFAQVGAALGPPKPAPKLVTLFGGGPKPAPAPPLAILSAAAAPKVAAQKPATVTNILDVLQRTRAAAAATRTAAPVLPPPPPPPSSSSNGGVVAAVAAAAAAAFILFRR